MSAVPRTREELAELRCEHAASVTFSAEPDRSGRTDVSVCGAKMVSARQEVTGTYVEGLTDAARRSLAFGVDPGPPQTRERPIGYDLTVVCEEGHETFLGTRPAR